MTETTRTVSPSAPADKPVLAPPPKRSRLDKLLEDYSREEVPPERARTWLSMGLMWASIGISLGLLLAGGSIGSGLALPMAVAAAFLGGLILTLVAGSIGVIGGRTHLSTAMISRFTFGGRAAIPIAFVLAMGSYGWFAVQLGMFDDAAAISWESLTGLGASAHVFIVIGGICMVTTAVLGYKGIDALSEAAVPLMIALIGASMWRALEQFSWAEIWALEATGDPTSLGVGITLTIGSFIVGAVVAPDVSRYSKSPGHTIGGAVFAFAAVTPVVLICGTVLSQAVGTGDVIQIMLRLGWGVLALVLVMFLQWTSNDNNLYSSALGLAVVFRKMQKWQLTLIAGGIGIVLALVGIYQHFVGFLLVLGIFIPPIAGAIIVDYYVVRRYTYATADDRTIPAVRVSSCAAWLVGSGVALLTTYTDVSVTTIPAVDGLLVAGVAQFVFGRFFEKRPDQSSTVARHAAETPAVTAS